MKIYEFVVDYPSNPNCFIISILVKVPIIPIKLNVLVKVLEHFSKHDILILRGITPKGEGDYWSNFIPKTQNFLQESGADAPVRTLYLAAVAAICSPAVSI